MRDFRHPKYGRAPGFGDIVLTRDEAELHRIGSMFLREQMTRTPKDPRRPHNVLSTAHAAALDNLMAAYILLASDGMKAARWAAPLPVGGGKTQSIIALVRAVAHLRLPLSFTIAASRIESLCDIKAELRDEHGVDEKLIGLWHTDKTGKYESADVEPWTRQILLATHSRTAATANLDHLNRYGLAPRSLWLWDESLLSGSSRSFSWRALMREVAGLGGEVESETDQAAMFNKPASPSLDMAHMLTTFLQTECLPLIREELHAQSTTPGREPQAIYLPTTDLIESHYLPTLIRYRRTTPTIRLMLEMAGLPLYICPVAQDFTVMGAVVTVGLAVDPAIDKIVVLDASWPIRLLEQLDSTIKVLPDLDGLTLKKHSHVTGHLRKYRGGKDALTSATEHRYRDNMCKAIAQIVTEEVPADEPVLVVSIKDDDVADASSTASSRYRRVPFGEAMRSTLRAAGVAADTPLDPERWGSHVSKVNFLTYGRENSTNVYRYVPNVILAGTYLKPEYSIAGDITAQRRGQTPSQSESGLIQSIQFAEGVQSAYQGLSRGACRFMVEGEAWPMTFWVLATEPNDVAVLLEEVMPGTNWQQRTFQTIKPAILALDTYLSALDPKVMPRVSFKKVKKDITGLSQWVFQQASKQVATAKHGYKAEDRSFVYGV